MRSPHLVAAVAFIAAAIAGGWLLRTCVRPQIGGDGIGYYAPLASLGFEGNLDLRDELAQVPPALLRAIYLTPDGKLGDPFPVGPALLWAPAVLAVRSLPPSPALDGPVVGSARTSHPAFAPRFARMVLWTDVAIVLAGGALLAGVLATQLGAWSAAAGTLAAVLGTPVFFYTLAEPAYSHAPTFFAVCVLLAVALVDRRRRLPLPLLGVVWGCAALVRWQDAMLGLLFAPRLLDEWRARRAGTAARPELQPGSEDEAMWSDLRSRTVPGRQGRRANTDHPALAIVRFVVPALVVFAPQMLFWMRIYGRPLLVPPGPEFLPPWKPMVVPLLFSTWNGAFVWSPVLLVGLIGIGRWRDRRLQKMMLIAILLEVYVCALVFDWWGGRAFGARRLVSLAPFAALGLAALLHGARTSKLRVAGLALVLMLGCAWSMRLARYHLNGLLPPNPGSYADYLRHYAPESPHARLYGYWDYPRFVSEVADAERMLRIDARRRAVDR